MARSYLSFPQLVDIIGEVDATALCRRHGGCAVYVAKTPERCSLVGIISMAAVESICAELGGEEYMLSRGPFRPVPIKEAIAVMLESGATHTEVAKEVGCTARYVAMVKSDLSPRRKPAPKPRRQAERKA